MGQVVLITGDRGPKENFNIWLMFLRAKSYAEITATPAFVTCLLASHPIKELACERLARLSFAALRSTVTPVTLGESAPAQVKAWLGQ